MIRSKDADALRIGFAIACVAWFIGFAHAAWTSTKLYSCRVPHGAPSSAGCTSCTTSAALRV